MTKEQLVKIIKEIPESNSLFLQCQNALNFLDGDGVVVELNFNPLPVEHYQQIMERRLENSKRIGVTIPGLAELVYNLQNESGKIVVGYAKSGDDLLYFYLNERNELLGLLE